MKIGKIMHRDVQVIGPEESLQNAAAMMKRLDAECYRSVNTTSWSA